MKPARNPRRFICCPAPHLLADGLSITAQHGTADDAVSLDDLVTGFVTGVTDLASNPGTMVVL